MKLWKKILDIKNALIRQRFLPQRADTIALFPLLGCVGTIFLGWYTDRYARDGDRAKMMGVMLAGLVACLLGVALLALQNTHEPTDARRVLECRLGNGCSTARTG